MSTQRDTATDTTHGSHAPIEDGVPQCACFSTGWDEGFYAGWDGGKKYAKKNAKKNGFLPTLTMYADPTYWDALTNDTGAGDAVRVRDAAMALILALEAADYIAQAAA